VVSLDGEWVLGLGLGLGLRCVHIQQTKRSKKRKKTLEKKTSLSVSTAGYNGLGDAAVDNPTT
jgi:hypothetical protein